MFEILKSPVFQSLSKAASDSGFKAWVVGGFVRDLVLDRPTKDIDVMVLGSGVEFAHIFASSIPGEKNVSYFRNFGTAQVKTDDWVIEFVGARKESYNRHSRNPVVENGSMEDDQNRRDFTINSMYLSLNAEDFGTLTDPFNGIEDLKKGIIRTPNNPSITFSDDPLRMLRAIRFATRLKFSIEEKTWQALKDNAHRISIVSQERITDEINGIIACNEPGRGFEMLFDTGLLQLVLPELAAMQGIETTRKFRSNPKRPY